MSGIRLRALVGLVVVLAGCIQPRREASGDAAEVDAVEVGEIDAPGMDGLGDGVVANDGATDGPADGPAVDDVVHVRAVDEMIGTGDLTVSGTLTIMTTGTPTATLPAGVSLAVVPQDGGGSDLVLLRVRTLTVTGILRATGTRPLVILAENVVIGGWIDVSASGATAGAGALTGGAGAGSPGGHLMNYTDAGGGGGSFGGLGADGGTALCDADCAPNQTLAGGARGALYGTATLAVLAGGSPGGRTYFPTGSACTAGNPGAGGGAVQIYARTSVSILDDGGIAAGGGGGDGGDQCNTPYNWLAGHGGGSGGAIYVQTASLQSNGLLVANGGGGGGSAGSNGDGANGSSAGRSSVSGVGGAASGMFSAAGGDGARQVAAAQVGGPGPDQGNGGGGGGGLGRIHVRTRMTPLLGTSSPTATTSTY